MREGKSQTRWVKFTYAGKYKFITKLFKNSNLKIYIKTENTMGNLRNNKTINSNKFNKCCNYQLICHDFNRKYILDRHADTYIYGFKNIFIITNTEMENKNLHIFYIIYILLVP
jgi:hypothetical protein